MIVNVQSGTYYAPGIGKTFEVPDTAGHEIMTRWPGCFEVIKMVKAEPKKTAAVEAEDLAEAEAAKMVSGYKNKNLG